MLHIHDGDELWTEITPEEAAELLSRGGDNRNIRKKQVSKYESDMVEDKWAPYSLIKIDKDTGVVLDGQHRLEAGIRSGKPFRAIMIYVPNEDMVTTDIGAIRTLPDMIRWQNKGHVKDVTVVAALVRAHAQWDGSDLAPNADMSMAEQVEQYKLNAEVYHAAANATGSVARMLRSKGCPVSSSMLALSWLLLKEHAEDDSFVDEFFNEWASGEWTQSSVFGMLTQAFNPSSKALPPIQLHSGRRRFLAVVLKGWNLWITGEENSVTRIGFNPGGPKKTRESFPTIISGSEA